MALLFVVLFFFFFKQKTAYEMLISDWSSDVCSSDLRKRLARNLLHQIGILRDGGVHDRPGQDRVAADILPPMLGRDIFGEPDHSSLRRSIRSEERRVGKECVSTWRAWWSPYHEKKNT